MRHPDESARKLPTAQAFSTRNSRRAHGETFHGPDFVVTAEVTGKPSSAGDHPHAEHEEENPRGTTNHLWLHPSTDHVGTQDRERRARDERKRRTDEHGPACRRRRREAERGELSLVSELGDEDGDERREEELGVHWGRIAWKEPSTLQSFVAASATSCRRAYRPQATALAGPAHPRAPLPQRPAPDEAVGAPVSGNAPRRLDELLVAYDLADAHVG